MSQQAVKKIAVITSNRSDFGPLYWLLDAIHQSPLVELQLFVGGSHLVEEHGYTIKEIEEKKLPILATIPYITAQTTENRIAQIALAMELVHPLLAQHQPDLVLILGDRYELLAYANVAFMMGIPIAHLCGGEITNGAFDDVIRHAVTKMSYWHFVANQEYANRVMQMGESPERVFVVGDVGLEHCLKTPLLTQETIENRFSCKINKPYFLMTYHPETHAGANPLRDQHLLLSCLQEYLNDFYCVMTYPNADANQPAMVRQLQDFQQQHSDSVALIPSLGVQAYISLLKNAVLLLGNSSSGLFEAASYKTPSVNFGVRQAGRLRGPSVFDAVDKPQLIAAINSAIQYKQSADSDWYNPYGDGKSVEKIMAVLTREAEFPKSNHKIFYDLRPVCQS